MLYLANKVSGKEGRYNDSNNKIFVTNISAPFICEFYKDQMNEVFKSTDLLICNEDEAFQFNVHNNYGYEVNNTENLKNIALKFHNLEKYNKEKQRVVIITRGTDSTLFCSNNQVYEVEVNKLSDKSRVIDTNGAGDTFVAGVFVYLL